MKFIIHTFLFGSLLALGVQLALAKDNALLDALSAEANNTSMKEDKALKGLDSEPSIVPKDIIDYDALETKVAQQIKNLLKESGDGADKEKSGKKFADELENVVSSALLQGNKMDDIRSAVTAAMGDIKKASAKAGDASSAMLESAGKALESIVAEKKDNTIQVELSSVVPENPIIIANTVTVLEGESLYKIAQRVYGSGNKYLDLYKANRDVLSSPNMLRIGQVLKVP
ncbi:MAG: LysM peptidoglycan-binding domain-containing protein [Cocleimonas sp.]|nr:LysM peptidoglycan-binding domain-containing protein [Cocleimonas sp.]